MILIKVVLFWGRGGSGLILAASGQLDAHFNADKTGNGEKANSKLHTSKAEEVTNVSEARGGEFVVV